MKMLLCGPSWCLLGMAEGVCMESLGANVAGKLSPSKFWKILPWETFLNADHTPWKTGYFFISLCVATLASWIQIQSLISDLPYSNPLPLVTPRLFQILVNGNFMPSSTLGKKPWSHLWASVSFTPHFQSSANLPSNYAWNLRTSHHFHCYSLIPAIIISHLGYCI